MMLRRRFASVTIGVTSRLFAERDNRMRIVAQPMRQGDHHAARIALISALVAQAILCQVAGRINRSRLLAPWFRQASLQAIPSQPSPWAIYATAWPQPSVHAASLQPQAASSPSVKTGCAWWSSPCAIRSPQAALVFHGA